MAKGRAIPFEDCPRTVAVERRSPAGVVLETRVVRFLMFYGGGNCFAQVNFALPPAHDCRTYDMRKAGRGTGRHGKAGWQLTAQSFGILQNLRAPRSM